MPATVRRWISRVNCEKAAGLAGSAEIRAAPAGRHRRAPHFHLWLVPKKNEAELRGAAYLAQQPPVTTSYSEAEAMSRKIREQFEQS